MAIQLKNQTASFVRLVKKRRPFMAYLSNGPVSEIKTDNVNAPAFRLSGHMDEDTSDALAVPMNSVLPVQAKALEAHEMTAA